MHHAPRRGYWFVRVFATAALMVSVVSSLCAQTNLSNPREMSPEIRQALSKKISLELVDSTLLEALFSVRDAAGLNIVVGNEVTGTVNASFQNSSVFEILDSLLITRGYGYRVVGGSLAIVPLESLGDQLPLFETAVIQLIQSGPEDLMPVIESMMSPEGKIHGVVSSNSLVVIDYPDRVAKIRNQIETLENAASQYKLRVNPIQTNIPLAGGTAVALPAPHQVRVLRPQYVKAATIGEALRPLLSPTGQIASVELEDKLVVTDQAENIERIEVALAQLDHPRPQVRIWALIYDCGIEDAQKLGVNWRTGLKGTGLTAEGTPTQAVVLDTVTAAVASTPNGMLTMTSLNTYADIAATLQALNQADDSRLLADPNVVVMNHEAATIAIVTEVPYQQLTQGLEGGTIGTTEFREAGVTLKVTPHIAQDETISLVVNPSFSLLTGFTEGDNAPIIDRRETTTTVRVANRQTLVLGGLRQRTRITENSSIPFLGRIPYLGHLFRHRSNTSRESELLVFITPEIITPYYSGKPREACVLSHLQTEIEQTPTSPIPYGIETIRAEDSARTYEINHPQWCSSHTLTCGLIGGSGRSAPVYCDDGQPITYDEAPLGQAFSEIEDEYLASPMYQHNSPYSGALDVPTPAMESLPAPVIIE